MKNLKNFFYILTLSVFMFSCKKETSTTTPPTGLPTITNLQLTDFQYILDNSATVTATISSEGNSALTAKGICWSTNQNPTINDSKTVNRLSNGFTIISTQKTEGSTTFTAVLNNLNPNTTYYIRIYATNTSGTAYSNQVTITTCDTASNLTKLQLLTQKEWKWYSFTLDGVNAMYDCYKNDRDRYISSDHSIYRKYDRTCNGGTSGEGSLGANTWNMYEDATHNTWLDWIGSSATNHFLVRELNNCRMVLVLDGIGVYTYVH